MDWRLILEYIRVLVWPSVTLSLGIIFRRQLGSLIRRIESARTPIGDATFRSQTEAIAGEVTEAEKDLSSEIEESNQGRVPDGETSDIPHAPSGLPPIDQRLAEFDNLVVVARLNPISAVMAAWREVETTLRQILSPTLGPRATVHETLKEATRRELLPPELVRSAEDLRSLRDNVAHSTETKIAARDAVSYVDVARRVAEALVVASTSLTSERQYERALFRTLLQWDFPVLRSKSDRLCDFYVGANQGMVGVEIKYNSNSSMVDIERLKENALSSAIPVIVATNAPLNAEALEFNRSSKENGSGPLREIVNWRGAEDDDILMRALLRAGLKA
jgi:hypothetical protein